MCLKKAQLILLLKTAENKLVEARTLLVQTFTDKGNSADENKMFVLDQRIDRLREEINQSERASKSVKANPTEIILTQDVSSMEDQLMDKIEIWTPYAQKLYELVGKAKNKSTKSRLLKKAQDAAAFVEKLKERVRRIVDEEDLDEVDVEKYDERLAGSLEILSVVEEVEAEELVGAK